MSENDVKILVCGMSRSGSTLLVKVLKRYFEKYHDKNMRVFPGKYYYNASLTKRMELARYRDYIAKLHLRREKIRLNDPISDFMKEFDLFFLTKRDIRDALASEIISLKSRELNRILKTSKTIGQEKIEFISRTLHKEHNLWLRELCEWCNHEDLVFFDWKYESYKEDQIATFKSVFSYVKTAYPFVHDLTEGEIRDLLEEIEKPVELSDIYNESVDKATRRDRFRRIALHARERLSAFSSTGGKVGYYKQFFTEKHQKYIKEEYKIWLRFNGYIR